NSTNSGATQASNSTDSGATQASNSTNSGATQTSNSTNSSATQASSDNFTLSVRSTNSSDDNGDPVSITITKDNFSDYFLLTGDSSYNQATGTITLTKDQVGQAGYVTLKNKISMDRSFDLKGLVYMGNKLDSQGGADGMAFTLHPNNVGQVGYSGGSAGMAGIPNALGFKIDTFYNGLSPEVWTDDDPGGVNSPFAAWTKTNENGIPDILLNNPSVQYLNKDHFLNSNAGFVPFELSYDANTKVLKVVMDGMIWTHTYDESYTDLALAISASTGLSHNLQQIQLTSFNYSASPTNIAKQNAREALEKEVNNIKQDITNDNTLTSSEKSAQTKVADANYQEALNNVESQTSPDGVNQAKDAGIAAIDAAHQPGTSLADQKQAAKDALEAEAKKIQAAIDNDVTLTATENSSSY
ncbi:lectin-like domain-containing protein, partial [Fructobacillus fructosus]|uniref:lectin-like domain-containing protein n=1 Tax=Fructobacillus fructosus TaxID=1631 RepID=UPI00200A50BB